VSYSELIDEDEEEKVEKVNVEDLGYL